MEHSCHKCGARVNADSAFCPKCGAVLGMKDAGGSRGGEWDMASTLVGKKPPKPPSTKPPTPSPYAQSPAGGPAPGAEKQSPTLPLPPLRARGSNTLLIAAVGFAAVLIIGGLLIFLLYLNSQG